MKNLDALHCWEVVVIRAAILTLHHAPRARAVEFAEREAARLPGAGMVKLRQVAHCTCNYQAGGAQHARGAVAKIPAPARPA